MLGRFFVYPFGCSMEVVVVLVVNSSGEGWWMVGDRTREGVCCNVCSSCGLAGDGPYSVQRFAEVFGEGAEGGSGGSWCSASVAEAALVYAAPYVAGCAAFVR